jgi:orotidine-5'-phosphate decarboxylase
MGPGICDNPGPMPEPTLSLPAEEARRRIIVPLDVPSADDSLAIIRRLGGCVGMFKVGLELFVASGPDVVRRIRDSGSEIFLDLKLHDIPNTVHRAVSEACRLGVSLLDVHIAGGSEMIAAARRALPEGDGRPRLLGITVLTSLDQGDLSEMGIEADLPDHVVSLSRLGRGAGLDGVVASPLEVSAVKKACGSEFIVVTPGIRPSGSTPGDQKRVMTPRDALAAGADYLVIGRPILGATDPVGAVESIVAEITS